MKYVVTYTFVACAFFALGIIDPKPALTDVILAFASHLGGCMAASALWANERAAFYKAQLRKRREGTQFPTFNAGLQEQAQYNLTHSAR